MESGDISNYLITRIRLVNFHNLIDETIEVRHGGHLFLLGDNASGKTTILDAIHYVLTAGESMEFNSAARVVGSRNEGRRVQGVIMRYNVDTGPLNPSGTVSYAALEILGRNGKPFTIGIGMTVRAMDEKLRRWGIIRECPLAEIPFVQLEKKKRRPTTRQEMRDHFGKKSGFYGRISGYKREVAQRLFGGQDLFRESCRLLSMGKAYREIVSHSRDYHNLFKRLLPEPKSDLFERIVNALRTLDESKGDLDSIEDKYHYLLSLQEFVDVINDASGQKKCLDWLAQRFTLDELEDRSVQVTAEIGKRQKRLESIDAEIRDCRAAQAHEEKRLVDLRGSDSEGVIGKEKELSADLRRESSRQKAEQKELEAAGKQLKAFEDTVSRIRGRLSTDLMKLHDDLTGLASDLPFSISGLTDMLEQAAEDDAPETVVGKLAPDKFRDRASGALEEPEQRLAVLEHQLEQAQEQEAGLKAIIEELSEQEEAGPELSGFAQAQKLLEEKMVTSQPLFRGLEWTAGLTDAQMAAVEEAIGEEILGTFIVPQEEYVLAKELIFQEYPGIRVAVLRENPEIPPWIREFFDLSRSDPAAVSCLVSEMIASRGPEFSISEKSRMLAFRSHERRLSVPPARLIGQEGRRKAQQRKLHRTTEEYTRISEKIEDLKRRIQLYTNERRRIRSFLILLNERSGELTDSAGRLGGKIQELAHAEASLKFRRKHLAERNQTITWLEERLQELRSIIARKKLDELEQKIAAVQNKCEELRERENELNKQMGMTENQIKGLEARKRAIESERDEALEQLAQLEKELPVEDPDQAEILERIPADSGRRPGDLTETEAALEAVNEEQIAARSALHERLRHPVYSAMYAFSYDETANELSDRGSRTIDELTEMQRQAIAEQREIINENTQELFRKIIMEGLFTFLKTHVVRLREMVKRINSLLSERKFGKCRYKFQIREVDQYRRLLEIVRDFNPFEEEDEKELRAFFEIHKEDIFDTEANEIPDVLDYRNWFHYDMRVHTEDEEGVVMDRRTKSIGSGGEQAVPNYLLILTVAHFLFSGSSVRLRGLIFDEAFYGIDSGRRDQIMGFASDLGLQLFVASPDQDGVKREVAYSTTLLVVKDENHDVHLFPYHWENPESIRQPELLEEFKYKPRPVEFSEEL